MIHNRAGKFLGTGPKDGPGVARGSGPPETVAGRLSATTRQGPSPFASGSAAPQQGFTAHAPAADGGLVADIVARTSGAPPAAARRADSGRRRDPPSATDSGGDLPGLPPPAPRGAAPASFATEANNADADRGGWGAGRVAVIGGRYTGASVEARPVLGQGLAKTASKRSLTDQHHPAGARRSSFADADDVELEDLDGGDDDARVGAAGDYNTNDTSPRGAAASLSSSTAFVAPEAMLGSASPPSDEKGAAYVAGVNRDARLPDDPDPLKPAFASLGVGSGMFRSRRPAWAKSLGAATAETVDEEEREMLGLPVNVGTKNPLLLNPRSNFMTSWDALVGVLLLYTAIWTPYEVAFVEGGTDSIAVVLNLRFFVNRVVDFGFFVDMCFNFFLPYELPGAHGKTVTDHGAIVRHYVTGWFVIDFVSILPYDLIGAFTRDGSFASLKVLRAIRLLRLAKLLRVVRVGRLFRRFEATREVNYAALALNKFSAGILFLTHWMACLFYLVAVTEDRRENWVTNYFFANDPEASAEHIDHVSDATLYVASVYWAVATLSTLGYGDVVPETNAERLYSVCCTFVGGAVYAYLLGSVCSIITNMDESSNTFFRQMDELNRFMKEKNVTSDLRMKLRDFFRFRRRSRAMVEWSGVMHMMSDSLRLDVAEEVFGGWVRNMPLFKDAPRRLPGLLSAHLSSVVLSPHEDVFANPIKRDCLFIVEKGLIATRGRIQPVGTLLGIERLFRDPNDQRGEPCPPAITLCHSVVLCLERDALMGVVAEFPKVRRNMRKIVVRVVFRRAVVRYARAVVASARGLGKGGGKGAAAKISGLLGVAGDDRESASKSRAVAEIATAHALEWLQRERPAEYASMQNAATMVQRTFRGHKVRRMMNDFAQARRYAPRGALELHELLFALGMQHHAPEFAALKLERRHLEVISALELCQVTRVPLDQAANLILAARDGTKRDDRERGGGRQATTGALPPMASSNGAADASKTETTNTPTTPPPPPPTTSASFVTPPPSSTARRTRRAPKSTMPSSKHIAAARAFGKTDIGMTVLLAAAKFREGGERRRARKRLAEEEAMNEASMKTPGGLPVYEVRYGGEDDAIGK